MKTGYKVCDVMTKKPITISPDMTVMQCAKMMAQFHVGTMVIAQRDKLLGILSEQDIVRKAVARGLDTSDTKVAELMVKRIITVGPEKDIHEAMVKMKDYNIRHLPVVNNKRMVGLVTGKDILKFEPHLFEVLVDKLELREEERKLKLKTKEGVCDACGRYSKNLRKVRNMELCLDCQTV